MRLLITTVLFSIWLALPASAVERFRNILPGVYEVVTHERIPISPTQSLRLRHALPANSGGQAVLGQVIDIQPSHALKEYSIATDPNGNRVATISLHADEQTTAIECKITTQVLLLDLDFSQVPYQASIPSQWPVETIEWLRASKCVNFDSPEFKQIAARLRKQTNDVRELIRLSLAETKTICSALKPRPAGSRLQLTAVDALTVEGSCTSDANLFAAILRACGVPARIVTGIPTWSGPLQMHFIVEVFVPGYGWYPVETALRREGWQPQNQVRLLTVPHAYEDYERSKDARFAPGIPYLALAEPDSASPSAADIFGLVDPTSNCPSVATPLLCWGQPAEPRKELLSRAQARWNRVEDSRPGLLLLDAPAHLEHLLQIQ
jgi:transglutaminase-like putative cysteine protease